MHCGKLTVLLCTHFLVNYKGRRKEEQGREWVKHGWSNNGRRGRDGGGKRKESVYPPA